MQQIFKVYKIKIDNASNIDASNSATKVNMTLKQEDAVQVRALLGKGIIRGLDGFNAAGENPQGESHLQEAPYVASNVVTRGGGPFAIMNTAYGKEYLIESKDIVLMGLLQAKMLLAFQAFSVLCAGAATIGQILDLKDSVIERFFINLIDAISGGMVIAIGAVIFYIILLLIGLVRSVIRYYNFRITDRGDSIHIEYGLFTKKTYTLMKKKISGFSYEQPMLMRMFGLGTLGVFAIGYGDGNDEDTGEQAILCPILKESDYLAFIEEIMPDIFKHEEHVKAEPKAFRYFFINFGFIFSMIVLAGTIIASVMVSFLSYLWIVGAVFALYAIISVILQYKNAGIYGNDICVSLSGGGFKKQVTYLKTSSIESVSEYASVMKHRRGVATVQLGYLAPLAVGNRKAKNVPTYMYEKVRQQIIY